MISLKAAFDPESTPTVLCLGAHSDDIEIGALGAVLYLKRNVPGTQIVWCVFSAPGKRADEARSSAEHCCGGFDSHAIRIFDYRDGYFPTLVGDLKSEFEAIKPIVSPDLIFTHYRHDAHQDHRLISELTRQTFRDHLILEYEVPKYDGDIGRPNAYLPVSEKIKEEKLDILDTYFPSQHSKSWFDRRVFASLMRLRGVECNALSGFAEAFFVDKFIFGLDNQ